jgi:YesN/AraC family two-component response regulator
MTHPNIAGFEYGYSSNSQLSTSYHYHNSYEIYMLIDGQNDCFIDDCTYLLNKNDMVFIEPNVVHKSNYNSEKYTRCVINFTNETLPEYIIKAIKPVFKEHIYTPKNPSFIKKLLIQMGAEYDKNDAFSINLIIGYLSELTAYCTRNIPVDYRATSTNPSIIRLVKHINANFGEDITRTQASKLLNMSEGHLSRLFRQSTGFGFNEYLRLIRIKNSKKLLLNTKKSVHQVAADCGFADSNYFSKIFKEDAGLSPLQYRKQNHRD